MARVVQGNPLFTSEEFNPEKQQSQRVIRDQGTKLARFLQGLQTAEAVASSKALGAVAGLAVKGIGKIGTAIEEAGKVAQAERAIEEQETRNKAEAEKLTAEQKALQELAKQRRTQAEPSTPADQGEMESTQRAFALREGQKSAYEDLNKAYREYKADNRKAKELGDKVRKYIADKVLTQDEAKTFFAGLEAKATKREQELLDLEKQTTKEAEAEADRFGTAVAKAEVEATKAKRDKALAERAKQNEALKKALPLLQLAQQEEEYVKLMDEEEGQGMVVPTARRVGVVDEDTALEGAGTRPANLPSDMTSSKAERLQLAQQYRKQAEALLSPLGIKADNLPPVAELTEAELRELQYLTPEETKAVVAPFKAKTQAERAGLKAEAREKGFRPPGPAEPTAPQPPAEEPVPFRENINVPQEQLKEVLTKGQGKEKEVLVKSLQALQDLSKKQPLSANQTEYARLATEYLRNLVNAEREGKGQEFLKQAREEMLQAETPVSADVSGRVTAKGKVVAPEFDLITGEQLTKLGQKIPQTAEMKAKPKTEDQLRAEMEAVRTGMPPAGMSVESFEIPELAEMEARVERVREAGGTDQAILTEYPEFKDLTAQEVVKKAVEEPDQARRAKLLEQAKQLEQQAKDKLAQSQQALQRKAKLPEGVSIDPATGGFVVSREGKGFSENELQALASNADTLEKRKKVLEAIETADIAPDSIMDLMTGGHKRSFAERLRPFFPTTRDFPRKTTAETEAEIELKKARRNKLVKETAEIEENAKSKRAKEKANADVDVARAADLREKGGASVNNVGYWESVIIKNLRKPGRVSGKSAADRAKATLRITQADRASQTTGVNKYHDNKIEVEEQQLKDLNAKLDGLTKMYGEDPTPPTKPDLETLTGATARAAAQKQYEKDKREYDDNVKAVNALKQKVKEAKASVEKAKEDKEKELNDLNDAYDKAEEKIRREAGVPQRPVGERSQRKQEQPPPKQPEKKGEKRAEPEF